jgi:hypothetical protein
MPLSLMNWHQVIGNRFIAEQKSYDLQEQRRIADDGIPKLNEDQRKAFDTIMTAVHDSNGKCFFSVDLEELARHLFTTLYAMLFVLKERL